MPGLFPPLRLCSSAPSRARPTAVSPSSTSRPRGKPSHPQSPSCPQAVTVQTSSDACRPRGKFQAQFKTEKVTRADCVSTSRPHLLGVGSIEKLRPPGIEMAAAVPAASSSFSPGGERGSTSPRVTRNSVLWAPVTDSGHSLACFRTSRGHCGWAML